MHSLLTFTPKTKSVDRVTREPPIAHGATVGAGASSQLPASPHGVSVPGRLIELVAFATVVAVVAT